MHVLFVHQNYPAQFGHAAHYLAARGVRCTFASQLPAGTDGGVERVQYLLKGGATEANHYCSRSVESAVWHSHAVYEALAARPDIRPDVVVAHSGYLTTSFLRELYDCAVVNYFEYYYHTTGGDMDFRPDLPYPAVNRLRAHMRNSVLLLDLETCDLGYSPTVWQRDRLPATYRPKVRAVFDGVDPAVWHPRPGLPRVVAGRPVPAGVKVVSYAARGLESVRGFDLFMQAAAEVCRRRSDVLFVVAGEDRVFYGGDAEFTGGKTFKEWVLCRGEYDLGRFWFVGTLPPVLLAELFAVTDLHMYLTVPFVLSWSLFNALACGATVLASDTGPVREIVRPGDTGLLADFFDVAGMADRIGAVLDRPEEYRHLGANAADLVRREYTLDVCLPKMLYLYQDALAVRAGRKAAGG